MGEIGEEFGRSCGVQAPRIYTIKELESLRFANIDYQRRKWEEIYQNLAFDVRQEYDGLRAPDHRNGSSKNQQQHKKKKNSNKNKKKDAAAKVKIMDSTNLGEVLDVNATKDSDVLDLFEPCDDTLSCGRDGIDVGDPLEEYGNINDEEDYSSSDECYNIQKPAFFVEGEPDFESGPPLDGWEYLRRVRWEAARIPKVKVVKLSSDKLNSDQTPYMPTIPEIPKCPPNLLPSKAWEKAFLDEFSELRRTISALDDSCNQTSLMMIGTGPSKQSGSDQQLNKKNPTLSSILGMDAVTRAAALRNSISTLETASILKIDDCRWLFALCAAVDAPLHADTCASLRCLLRKCSHLLSLKSERDGEVAMLSILITITGKYFGQLDNL